MNENTQEIITYEVKDYLPYIIKDFLITPNCKNHSQPSLLYLQF